ncbi:MAG: hypothetical protein LBS50_01435 [Prevotellaceae bacterium]|jgi:hypothetical protein|nr:hypothetical protein [Prevotellaceae bacterium]
MNIFNTNIEILMLQLLPSFLRKPLVIAFLNAFSTPFKSILNLVKNNRQKNLNFIKITSQVCSLEKALNDFFETQNITISDGNYREPLWLALQAEQQPLWLGLSSETPPLWLGLSSENGFENEAFIVHCPNDLQSRQAEIIAFVNQFKLAGKTFSIIYF